MPGHDPEGAAPGRAGPRPGSPERDTWYAEAPTEQIGPLLEAEEILADRYEILDELGSGGMGAVYQARDLVLGRVVALKIAAHTADADQRSRFIHEAQATAQLEHPGIVPVYDHGELPDGGLYYTMPVVRGRTLGEVIGTVHRASGQGRWREAPDGSSFRRLVGSFLAVCEAMAYAHHRGVIHRDLKPENVMLGPFGQTLVVDWGLAKVLGAPPEDLPTNAEMVETARSSLADQTQWGTVSGTPHYMPPEQAQGLLEALGPATDVWSLGAILYELLTGRPPFAGSNRVEVLAAVIASEPDPIERVATLPLPGELVELAMSCLVREPELRPPHAGELAREVRAWLDGEQRRRQALDLVYRADALVPEIRRVRVQADQDARRAESLLKPLESWRHVADKLPGWTLQDRAEALRTEADRIEQRRLHLLRQALGLVPDLEEAHAGLADYYRLRHAEVEARGDLRQAAEIEALLRAHHNGRYQRYLEGRASLRLHTEPADVTVEVRPWVLRERRLVRGGVVYQGRGPEVEVELSAGAWLVTLRAEGRAEVRYPIHLSRGGRWDGVPPGSREILPIRLPERDELGPEEIYVPPGWFEFGGDPEAHAGVEGRRVWVDAFAIDRTPVTVGSWLAFLTAIREEDPEAFAWCAPPRHKLGWREGPEGALVPGPDREGFEWEAEMAIPFVSYRAACRYAAWRAERDGLPWRLPTEVEWEKAARGTDRRIYAWGSFLDPTWCAIQGSRPGDPLPAPVGCHPVDASPYGVLDCCGGITEWTSTVYRAEGPVVVDGREQPSDPTPDPTGARRRVGRGASFYFAPLLARVCTRYSMSEGRAEIDCGLRLVRSV